MSQWSTEPLWLVNLREVEGVELVLWMPPEREREQERERDRDRDREETETETETERQRQRKRQRQRQNLREVEGVELVLWMPPAITLVRRF